MRELTARLLVAERGAKELVLSSRSGRVQRGSEADAAWLDSCGARVRRVRCDVSNEAAVLGLVRGLRGDGMRLGGVFHAAGVLADALLVGQAIRPHPPFR